MSSSRQVLVWSLPTVAFVLSILWYRRRHRKTQTDPGGTCVVDTVCDNNHSIDQSDCQFETSQVILSNKVQEEEAQVTTDIEPLISTSSVVIKQSESFELSSIQEKVKEEEAEVEKEAVIEEEEIIKSETAAITQSCKMTEVEEQTGCTVTTDENTNTDMENCTVVMSKISVDVSKTEEEENRPRDSANHSPAEAMLASPSISNDSDTHSVGSNDSGKGGSDVTTHVVEEDSRKASTGKRTNGRRRTSTSSRSSGTSEQAAPSGVQTNNSAVESIAPVPYTAEQACLFEFVIPQQLVGRLIGKHGCFVQQIKNETNSSIFVKRHHDSPKYKICAIEGTQSDIEEALKMIRKKFPLKKYPGVTLERVMLMSPTMSYPVVPDSLQMYLVEGVNNDVILSSLVSAGHMFLQQPTHPTFPVLSRLIMFMTQCYSEQDSPSLPYPAPGIICAAPSQESWYRAEVIDVRTELPQDGQEGAEEISVCDIKFVDYGGFMTVPSSDLRQIRSDFMMLPFQATECYLAVTPSDEEEGWSVDATQCVEDLTKDQVLQAQVVGYAENGVPFVRLFSSVQGSMAVMVNEVLVHRGLAKYFEPVSV